MIRAKHTFLGKQVCSFYAGYKLDQAFRKIEIRGDEIDLGLPVLMLANHFSKWDGFIQYRINQLIYRRKFHVMMLEEQLLKHPVLIKGGAFSVRKNSRESLESLRYTLGLLRNRNNLILVFPQGRIETLYTDPYMFQNGISYLLKRIEKPVQLVLNVNLVDYFSFYKPKLTCYIKVIRYEPGASAKDIESLYNEFVRSCKKQQRG